MENSKKKFNTFKAIFSALGTVSVVDERMYSIPRMWKGISPYFRKVISLIYGGTSQIVNRARTLNNLNLFLLKMYEHHGATLTVKWLKSSHVALQRSLGKDNVTSLRELEPDLPLPRVYSGLPAFIPKADRIKIRKGDPKTIQFYLTCFSVYRVLVCDFFPKLQTITQPYTGDQSFLDSLVGQIEGNPVMNRFRRLDGWDSWFGSRAIAPTTVQFSQSSSPTNRVAWHGIIFDSRLVKQSGFWDDFLAYATKVRAFQFLSRFEEALGLYDRIEDLGRGGVKKYRLETHKRSWAGALGQLAFKEEAAGKLRAFALVDVWTQSLLEPLHSSLFSLLKIVPNDGTFDQDASVNRSSAKSMKSGCAYSFDLSAATDRLPIKIQIAILNVFFGNDLGTHWGNILVNRDYTIPARALESYNFPEGTPDKVRYAVGQPMGALSSWAMLAISHHFIVQYCSMKIGRSGWEENYEILGDDLVIFDAELANKYLEVAKLLGVEINLSKSISSRSSPVFEFAKRTVVSAINVSAISFKQFISEASMGSRVANILHFARQGLIRTNSVLAILLSRFGKFKSLRDLNLPSLSLLGALFNQNKVSLRDIVTAMIDPEDDEFDFEESDFSLPSQSLLTAEKELLNARRDSLGLPNRNVELFEEIESDLTASVLMQALARAKALENSWDDITESKRPTDTVRTDDLRRELPVDKQIAFNQSIYSRDSSRNFLARSWAYCLVNPNFVLLRDMSLISAIDGWVLDLIMDGSGFDANDLVDQVEEILKNHAKYQNCGLADAISLLDVVEQAWQTFDIVSGSRADDAKVKFEVLSPVFSWIAKSQGLMSRRGYLAIRKNDPWS
nr:MAG: putative RNA dependent RNA polymerase [Inner Mongolia grassland mitovirus 3]